MKALERLMKRLSSNARQRRCRQGEVEVRGHEDGGAEVEHVQAKLVSDEVNLEVTQNALTG